MISRLTIGNFKAFGPAQTIPLRPITLVFGPNSAGKSSIIQSLLLAKHVQDTGKVDAHQTTLGGAAVDLGGFGNYVRNHNSRLETVIEFCVPRSAISAKLHELDKFEMLRISYRIRKADSAQGGSNPAIASVALRLDGNELVSFERSDVGELQIDVSAIDSPHWFARYGHQYGYQLSVLELLEERFESLDTEKRDLLIKWAKEEVENAVQELSQMKFAAAFLALENRSPLSREYPDYDVFGTDADFDRPDRDPFGFYERELKRENDEQEPSSSEVWARAFRTLSPWRRRKAILRPRRTCPTFCFRSDTRWCLSRASARNRFSCPKTESFHGHPGPNRQGPSNCVTREKFWLAF